MSFVRLIPVTLLRTLRVKSSELPFSEASLDFPFILRLIQRMQTTPAPSVGQLRRRLARYRDGRSKAVVGGEDVTKELASQLEVVGIPASIDHASAITDGASMLLIFAFLERTLRAISEDLAPAAEVRRFMKAKATEGNVNRYLRFLRESAGLSFVVSLSVRELLRREAQVRNHFAHGDWLMHYFISNRGDAEQLANAVASLIESLDAAYRAARSAV